MVRSHMKARVLWPESPWTSGLWGGSARLQVQTRVHPSTCEDGPRLHVLRPPRELPEDGAKSSRNSFQERVEGAATLFHRDSRHRRLFFFFLEPLVASAGRAQRRSVLVLGRKLSLCLITYGIVIIQ